MITNATIPQVNQALETINRKYSNNIQYQREPEQVSSNRVRFTLRCKSSKGAGARHGFYTNKNGEYKRSIAACWHVHGDLFDALLDIDQEIYILAGSKRIDKTGGNWQDWNIGSIINPMYYSEACNC